MDSYLNRVELMTIGFKSVGEDVKVSKFASIYGAEKIEIGNHVRIDDFCILSGKIKLGNYIHIAAYCGLFGADSGITMMDYSGLSSRCAIYAESDDYSGQSMTNPTVPNEYRNLIKGSVEIGKHALIGTGSTILPNVNIGEGATAWSMTLINRNLKPWMVYFGIPCKKIGERERNLLTLEKELEASR